MAAKPTLTEAGLLSERHGERPHTVRLREEKQAGSSVLLDFTLADGTRRKVGLGFAVRSRGKWDMAALERARTLAKDRAAELRLDLLRDAVKPVTLTVRDAFDLYHDEERGNLPASAGLRMSHLRAAKIWCRWFGAATPWNQIRRADVDALMRHYADRDMIPTGLCYVEILRSCHHWLDAKAGYEDALRDPTKGFGFSEWKRKHRPRRPRYSEQEMAALIRVRHDVDPRFALFIAFMADSVVRPKAVRGLWRSMVDRELDMRPTIEDAPYGWVEYPALKGQDVVLHFLTSFQRRELELAFTGYLRLMEEQYRATGIDYPLFPAVRMAEMKDKVVRPSQTRARQPIADAGTKEWARAAEAAAGVQHMEYRLLYGFRRALSDYIMRETDLKTLTVAGGWTSQRTPESIYLERQRHGDRAAARTALERLRGENDGQTVGPA